MKKKVQAFFALSLSLPFSYPSAHAADCTDTGTADPVKVFTPKLISWPGTRIPSIIKTNSGRLVAFAEARTGGDSGKKAIVESYSDDGGTTWTLKGIVATNGGSSASNPVPVYDAQSDTIFLSVTKYSGFEWESLSLALSIFKSVDNGITWEEKVIFPNLLPDYKQMLAGPGHGFQMQSSAFNGRLVIPFWTYDAAGMPGPGFLYSDNHGTSWSLGAQLKGDDRIKFRPNETTATELKNGSVLLISRTVTGAGGAKRTKAISNDVSKSMGPLTFSLGFSGPTVEGAILRKDNKLLFSSPLSSDKREDLGVRVSYDEGDTWAFPHQLTTGSAAYSDLVMVDDKKLGIIYESDKDIVFRTACLSGIESAVRPLKDKSGSAGTAMAVGHGSTPIQLGSMDGQKNSLVMSGKNYVSVAKNAQNRLGASDFTINLWFRKGPQWSAANQESLFAIGSAGGDDQQWLRIYPNGSLRYVARQISRVNPDVAYNFGSGLADNKWHMVTIVRSDQQLHLYVDGRPAGTLQTAFKSGAPIDSEDSDFGYIFGARPEHSNIGYAEMLNGELGEVRVYRRVIPGADVKNLYQRASVANDGLVLYLD